MLQSCNTRINPCSHRSLSTIFAPRLSVKKPNSLSCRKLPLPVCAASSSPVFESLTLLHFQPGTAEEVVSDVVDRVWSVQYLVPGPIVGAAGPLKSFEGSNTTDIAFTHAVLFRFGTEALQTRFQSSSTNQDILIKTAGEVCDSIHTINYNAAVPNELESIFRRGSEWDVGVECILGLSLNTSTDTNTSDDANEFLALTQQLSTSSAFGAVQAVFGPCTSKMAHVGSEASLEQPDYIFAARFQQPEQLEGFLVCPPVAAMIEEDERCPLKAIWHTALDIFPTNNNSQKV